MKEDKNHSLYIGCEDWLDETVFTLKESETVKVNDGANTGSSAKIFDSENFLKFE